MWLKQVETRLWLYQCLSDDSQKNWGCIPSRWGKSPRGIVIATSSSQWIQTATNYFKPQEENLLHENDTSHHIPMSWHTCSPVYTCQVMHRETTVTFYAKSVLFSASYLLGTFFITIRCPAYIVLYNDMLGQHVIYLLIICASKLILLLTGWFYNQSLVEIQWIWFKTSGSYLFYYQSLHGVNSVFVLKEKSLTDLEVWLFQLCFVEAFMWPAGYHSRSVWF